MLNTIFDARCCELIWIRWAQTRLGFNEISKEGDYFNSSSTRGNLLTDLRKALHMETFIYI
jgi:hypothetical protein